MNVAAFIEYLNKTKHLHLDADYYGNIEVWRQWWKGDVPDIHDQKRMPRTAASFRGVWLPCGCLSTSARTGQTCCSTTRTTLQIGDASTSPICWAAMSSRSGGLLRQLHFWRNANALVEQAYWSGTGAFVLSAENLTVVKLGNAVLAAG